MKLLWYLMFLLIFLLQYTVKGWIGPKVHTGTAKKYYISEFKANRSTAFTLCRRNGWTLATLMDRSEQNTLEELAEEAFLTEDIWIGLELYKNGSNPYGKWTNGSDFDLFTGFENWAGGEPVTFNTSTQEITATCVRLWYERNWQWDDYYCDFQEVSKTLFACEAKNSEFYTSEDIARIGDGLLDNTKELESSRSTVQSLSTAMNELLAAKEEFFGNKTSTSRDIFKSFDKFLEDYDVNKENNITIDMDNLEVKIKKAGENETIQIKDNNSNNETLNNIEVVLSPEIFGEAISRENKTDENYVQVNTIFYRNPSLFQVDDKRYTKDFSNESRESYKFRKLNTSMFGEEPGLQLLPNLLTKVINVDIKNINMSELPSPIYITNYNYWQNFSPPHINDMKPKKNPICAFWDLEINEWSTKGCKTFYVPRASDDESENETSQYGQVVTCECNHLTHFAILLDTTYIYAPDYLIHMTIAGCTLSIICLLAAIVTILCFSQLRSKTAQQILLHICINLLIVNIIFLVGIDRRDHVELCTYSSAIMHYFLLTTWAWMFVEALFLFLSLVVPFYNGGVRGKIIPMSTITAYGVPAVIAGLTAGFTDTDYYLSEKYCWLSMSVLIPALLVPVAIVLVANIVIFFSIMYAITCRSKAFRKNVDISKVRQTMVRALCMIFILGIPWLFGFFMLLAQDPETKRVFAICFTVFNTTQGVAIFFFFCARQEQVRKLWMTPLNNHFRNTIRRIRSTKQARRDSEAQLQQQSSNKTQMDETIKSTNNSTLSTSAGKQSTSSKKKSKRKSRKSSTDTSSSPRQQTKNPFRHGWS